MKVSVVIPVYNAEKFVFSAVQSALFQEEVREVVLIEDCSPDGCLRVCRELAKSDSRITLFTTADFNGKGAAFARNIGIRNARFEWISFLDADDYMRPFRFSRTRSFADCDLCDGVYEAVGRHFENEVHHARWRNSGRSEITTVSRKVSPSSLFVQQSPVGSLGYACTDGWTVRKSVFAKTGLFNSNLMLHEDTDLFMRFAIAGRMFPGEIENPVAMRRVHDNNRITEVRLPEENFAHRIRMWGSTWRWACKKGYGWQAKVLLDKLLDHCSQPGVDQWRQVSHSLTSAVRFQRAARIIRELVEQEEFHRRLRVSFLQGMRSDFAGLRRRIMVPRGEVHNGEIG